MNYFGTAQDTMPDSPCPPHTEFCDTGDGMKIFGQEASASLFPYAYDRNHGYLMQKASLSN